MYVSSSIQRARIYASGSLEKITYYDNLIYVDEEDSSASERSVTLETPKKVRYIAFCLAKKAKDGGWIASEFEVYGQKSEVQEPPVESDDPKYPEEGTDGGDAPTESDNLLFGLTPDEAGLVKKDVPGILIITLFPESEELLTGIHSFLMVSNRTAKAIIRMFSCGQAIRRQQRPAVNMS